MVKEEAYLDSRVLFLFISSLFSLLLLTSSQTLISGDAAVMVALKKSLNVPDELGWTDSDPCKWKHVECSSQRVTKIQIGVQGLQGTLPPNLGNLTTLQRFEVMSNNISGPLPSLAGLNSLQILLLNNNNFSSIPSDFFAGMSSLLAVAIDNNPFSAWEIPESLRSATNLQNISANTANITGKIPDFLGGGDNGIPGLTNIHMSFNSLEGGLPPTFADSSIQSLWLNGQNGAKLSGSIDVLQTMTSLRQVWLHSNSFTGTIPDLSGLTNLELLNLRDNQLTGMVPLSLVNLPSLIMVNLTHNMFQGPTQKFANSVIVDSSDQSSNSFCLNEPGADCDPRVNILLSAAQSFGYPLVLADRWKGNNPCSSWFGITCDNDNIIIVSLQKMGLNGTISSNFSAFTSLQKLLLADNNLTGTIPNELTNLPNLKLIDVSYNNISGKIPSFKTNVILNINGNPTIGKDPNPATPTQGKNSQNKTITKIIIGVLLSIVLICALLLGLYLYYKKRKSYSRVQNPNAVVIHPSYSGDQNAVKITIAGPNNNRGGTETPYSVNSNGLSDIHIVDTGAMVISIEVLRSVTNNFNQENVLGRGGFGTVYKGELHDGAKIAVKRMECGAMGEKGLTEFQSEITVLTKVRHKHLVGLLGYCLDGYEKLLVYEYMPQGTLSSHLFNWRKEGLKPLEWMKRLTIALDVARGVEYLHGLANQCFIHRDLKPSNILLGDDMRAKVADFGLVRLAPEGNSSFETRLAGTFGYLAPEYAVTGRVTTKVDVFSFGVILMELITGRKALDDTQAEESVHLVNWFRRMSIKKETFHQAIDPTIELDQETLASISTITELAGHCSAREPSQRPDMSHVVNVLSSLAELWKPSDIDDEDLYRIDLDLTLPQALKKWQSLEEGSSCVDDSSVSTSFLASNENTETSIPLHPSDYDGFSQVKGR